ncbi:MAG: hypothetical protein HY904_21540 [Deltaproteobacteria bacterium]|nr:hypothetical protein [Deltaproteobacteria bacterium]
MQELVVLGLGQLGELFAVAALRHGMRVSPVRRTSPRPLPWNAWARGAPILVAVAEDALAPSVAELPPERLADVILLQNELFPSTWRTLELRTPTIMVPWFNRKNDQPVQVGPPTRVRGPHAALVRDLHAALRLPCELLSDDTALAAALAGKYAFIVTVNALGLKEDRTVSAWWRADPALVDALLRESAALAALLVDAAVADRAYHLARDGVELHQALSARGRSSRARVQRALARAHSRGMRLTALELLLPEVTAD